MIEINDPIQQNSIQISAESGTDFGASASVSEQTRGIGGASSTNKQTRGWYLTPSLQQPEPATKETTEKKAETKTTETENKKYTAHVRFTDKELNRIKKDSEYSGKTIPMLLKIKYFHDKYPYAPFSNEDCGKILTALNRIGNNINQIARSTNAGFREGFSSDIETIKEEISLFKKFVGGTWQ